MIAHEGLPMSLIEKCMDVLKEVTSNERDFIRVVVESISDLRDDDDVEHMVFLATFRHFVINLTFRQIGESQSDTTQTTTQSVREKSIQRKKDRSEMTHEEALRADFVDMRCLSLCISMLERVHGVWYFLSCRTTPN
jgi:condensin complex subunit 3